MDESLSQVERAVYELIQGAGELMAKDVPPKMAGAVPSLIRRGFVEKYKRASSPTGKKKQTYLRATNAE